MFHLRVYLTNICLAGFDLVVTAACFAVAGYAALGSGRSISGLTSLLSMENAASPAPLLIVWISLSCYFGMYRSRRLDSPLADCFVIFKVGMVAWMLCQSAIVLLPAMQSAKSLTLTFVAATCVTLATARSALRLTLREFRRRGYNVKRLLLVASEELGDRLERKIAERSHYGYRIAARLACNGPGEGLGAGLIERVRDLLRSGGIDDVILALPVRANELSARLVAECESQGINVRIVPDLFPLIQADTQIYDFDGIPLVNARLYPAEFLGYFVFKRAFDLCVSVLVLILFSPLFLVLSLLVKFTSPGPVFFTQDRVGMNGRRFRIIKFRTMSAAPSLDPDSHWTVHNDSNITPLGRWLRRLNFDELPQFFNVLKGEMSIVGPRPERPFFLERFKEEVPEYMARHYVKSGITGWAQVNGWKGDTPIPQRVAHDLYYIRNWAVSFDIKILFLTLARTIFPGASALNESKHGGFRP